MTDLKAVQAAIAASEGRLRTLMEGIPQLVWRSCTGGRWSWASPQWLDFTGQCQEDSHDLGWLEAVHTDDRGTTMLGWDEANSSGKLDVEYRVRRAADGVWLWHHTRAVPVRDVEGTIVEWLGTTTDVHALRELQERQGVLVAELQHRTRNLITVVRSLSDRTVGNSASLDDFKVRFGHRLAALSRVQGLLSHLSAGERIDFGDLLRSELTALGFTDGQAERVTLDGPSYVSLRSATVQTLALAIHELSTNAVKYGALATDAVNAHLTVCWYVEPATADKLPILRVEWRESGVDMRRVVAPARGGGYGRELIERALPYQLGAETAYELGADGVRCTIEMPISREVGHVE
jgi:PAS domain S-box-containing protein